MNLRRSGTAFIAAVAVIFSNFAGAESASASPDFSCMKRSAYGTHVVRKPMGGDPAYMAWQVQPLVTAYDLCLHHGDINVSVGLVDGAVRAEGGYVGVESWVRYRDVRTGAFGGWIALKRTDVWPTMVFRPPNGQEIGMSATTATTTVAIRTTFWRKKDGSNFVPMASAWTYCALGASTVQSGRPTAGPCYGG